MIGNPKVMSLIKQRNEFLNEHPNLYALQDMWDEEMAKAGNNQHNRLAVAQRLLREQLTKLQDANIKLIESLTNFINAVDKVDKW